ncbi:4Fe-4S cluster-binding domain-containing protein [Vibrio metschnikovii]|uniref:Radical SAM protein n=3 Tax=Bacteria TaxID=2 RepID=A0AAU6T371_UNCXX|nr:radical SAM protein [Vibrio metschnikovii]EKO3567118.1 radical SAM protein [Vibrio metschnikovii]EKO3574895.1 radical SAM protein [Vibrio metschnikovii]EKO3586926.1 radical SAM protein [Vibrio metschnikovii]EKO3596650.1 radical SAM protein [Vibrio metschnikovii]
MPTTVISDNDEITIQRSITGQVARLLPYSVVDGPGNRLVFFLQGCNYRCPACHNPQTIARCSEDSQAMAVFDAVEQIRQRRHFITGITLSGGEASLQIKFVRELFKAVKTTPELSSLTCLLDSNGSLSLKHWQSLLPWMDGAMIDLKAWHERCHYQLTGHSNVPVKRSLHFLAEHGKLSEVRLLLIPDKTDYDLYSESLAQYLNQLQQLQSAKGAAFQPRVNAFANHGVSGIAKSWSAATPEQVSRLMAKLTDDALSISLG